MLTHQPEEVPALPSTPPHPKASYVKCMENVSRLPLQPRETSRALRSKHKLPFKLENLIQWLHTSHRRRFHSLDKVLSRPMTSVTKRSFLLSNLRHPTMKQNALQVVSFPPPEVFKHERSAQKSFRQHTQVGGWTSWPPNLYFQQQSLTLHSV